jgi:hypothetical protein
MWAGKTRHEQFVHVAMLNARLFVYELSIKMSAEFWSKNLKGGDHSEDLGVHKGKIVSVLLFN